MCVIVYVLYVEREVPSIGYKNRKSQTIISSVKRRQFQLIQGINASGKNSFFFVCLLVKYDVNGVRHSTKSSDPK